MYTYPRESCNNTSMTNCSMLQMSFDSAYSFPECSVQSLWGTDTATNREWNSNHRNSNNYRSDDNYNDIGVDSNKKEYDYGNYNIHSNDFAQGTNVSKNEYWDSTEDKMYGFDMNSNNSTNNDNETMDDYMTNYKIEASERQQLNEFPTEEEDQKYHKERVQQWLQQIQRRLSSASTVSTNSREYPSENQEEEEKLSSCNIQNNNSNSFDHGNIDKNVETHDNNSKTTSTIDPKRHNNSSLEESKTTLILTSTKAPQKEAASQTWQEKEDEYDQSERNHGRYTKRESISTSHVLLLDSTPKLTSLEKFYLMQYDESANNIVNGTTHSKDSANNNNNNHDKESKEFHYEFDKLQPLERAVDENVSNHSITQMRFEKDNKGKQEKPVNKDVLLPFHQQTNHRNNSYKSVINSSTEPQAAKERLIRQCKLTKQSSEDKQYSPSRILPSHLEYSKAKQSPALQSLMSSTMHKATFTPLTPFSYLTSYQETNNNVNKINEWNTENDVTEQKNTTKNTNTNAKTSRHKSSINDSYWSSNAQSDKYNSSNRRNKKGNTSFINYKTHVNNNETNGSFEDVDVSNKALYLASELLDQENNASQQKQNKTHSDDNVSNMHEIRNTKDTLWNNVQSNKSPHFSGNDNKHINGTQHEMINLIRSRRIEDNHTSNNSDKRENPPKQDTQPTNHQKFAHNIETYNNNMINKEKSTTNKASLESQGQPFSRSLTAQEIQRNVNKVDGHCKREMESTNNTENTDLFTSPVSVTNRLPYAPAKHGKLLIASLTPQESESIRVHDNEINNTNKSNKISSNNTEFSKRSCNTDGTISNNHMQQDKNSKSGNISESNKFDNRELEKMEDKSQRQLNYKYIEELVALNRDANNNNETDAKTKDPRTANSSKSRMQSKIDVFPVENYNPSKHNAHHDVVHSITQRMVHSANNAGLSSGGMGGNDDVKPRSNSLYTTLMRQGEHGILLKRTSYTSQPLPSLHTKNKSTADNKNKHQHSLSLGHVNWVDSIIPTVQNDSVEQKEYELSTSLEEKIAKHEIVVDEVELLRQERDKNVEHLLDTSFEGNVEHQHQQHEKYKKQESQAEQQERFKNRSSPNINSVNHNNNVNQRRNSVVNNEWNSRSSSKTANWQINNTTQEENNKTHSLINTKHDLLSRALSEEVKDNDKAKRFVPVTTLFSLPTSMLNSDQSLESLSIPSFYRLSLHEHEINNINSHSNSYKNNNNNTQKSVMEYITGADVSQGKSGSSNTNQDSKYDNKLDGSNTKEYINNNNNNTRSSEIDGNVAITDKIGNTDTSAHVETHGRHSVSFAPDVIFFRH